MEKLQLVVKRNLMMYRKNRSNLILSFSFLLMVMALYFVCLKGFVLQAVTDYGVEGKEGFFFADRLMVAGLLIIITATSCFPMIQQLVKERCNGGRREDMLNGIEPMTLALGEWMAATIISFGFSVFTFFAYELYFLYEYGEISSSVVVIKAMVLLFLASCVNAGVLLVCSYFLQSVMDFWMFSNLYGTLLGFMSGIYLPYFFYGGWLKRVLFFLPSTQLVSLMRNCCLTGELERLGKVFSAKQLLQIKREFGILLQYGGKIWLETKQLSEVILALSLLLAVIYGVSGREARYKI